MQYQFDTITLYRKEDAEFVKSCELRLAHYDRFNCSLDLMDLVFIEESEIDKRVTAYTNKAGIKGLLLISYSELRNVLRKAQNDINGQLFKTTQQ